MLIYTDYDIVFQEIPDHVTLAINMAGCPNGCPCCHSPHLQEDRGNSLTQQVITELLERYKESITCICIMGGDNAPYEVGRLAKYIRTNYTYIYIGWYSGRAILPAGFDPTCLDYLKLGPYVESLGGLNSPKTNQRLYRIDSEGNRTDITSIFWKTEINSSNLVK